MPTPGLIKSITDLLTGRPRVSDFNDPAKVLGSWARNTVENVEKAGHDAYKYLQNKGDFAQKNFNETNSYDIVPPLGQKWAVKSMSWVFPNMRIDTDPYFAKLKEFTSSLFERPYYRTMEFLGSTNPMTIETAKNRRIRAEQFNLSNDAMKQFDLFKRRVNDIKGDTPSNDINLHVSNLVTRARDRIKGTQGADKTWQEFLDDWETHMFKGTPLESIETPEVKALVDRTRKHYTKVREEAESLGLFPNYKKLSDEETLYIIARDRSVKEIPKDANERKLMIDKWKTNQGEKLDKYWTTIYDPVLVRDNRADIHKILFNGYMKRENVSFRDSNTMVLKRFYSGSGDKMGINEMKLKVEFIDEKLKTIKDPKEAFPLKSQKTKYEKRIELYQKKHDRLKKSIEKESQEKFIKRRKYWEEKYNKVIIKEIDGIIHSPTAFMDRRPNPVKKSAVRYFRQRVLDEFREELHPYMERDPITVSHLYNRYMIPRLEEKKAGFDIQEVLRAMDEEAIAGWTAKPELKDEISKSLEDRKRDLLGIYDRVMNQDNPNQDPRTWGSRVTNNLLKINNMLKLPMVTLSSLPDVGNITMAYGLKRFGKILHAVATDPLVRAELQKFPTIGIGGDLVTMDRMNALADIYHGARGNMWDRAIDWMSSHGGLLTLLNPWTDAWKRLTGLLAQNDILQTARTLAEGGKIEENAAIFLRHAGIDEDNLRAFWEQWMQGSKDVHSGVFLANTDAWEPAVRDAFNNSLARIVDNIIVTPTAGPKPLWASSNMGRLGFQYRSFGFQATQAIALAGLQMADAQRLNGMMICLFFGWLSYASRSVAKGNELSDNPMDHITEAIDRSGLMGLLTDVNLFAERATGGRIGMTPMLGGTGLSRQSQVDITGMLSPSLGTIKDAGMAMSGLFQELPGGQVTAGQINAQFRMIPYSNLFYINFLTNKMKAGVHNYFGVDE